MGISPSFDINNLRMKKDIFSPIPEIQKEQKAKNGVNEEIKEKIINKKIVGFKAEKEETKEIPPPKLTMKLRNSEENKEKVEIKKIKSPSKRKNGKPKKKRRRDVIFKTILRECRRYFQIQLSDLTGFISSKKIRNDDYMYKWMDRFNREFLKLNGSFEENFYLAWLLYPQDLSRNVDLFLKEKKGPKSKNKIWKEIAAKIHDTLYKYSHDKLEFFVSKKEIAFLFCNFYENGAGDEKNDPKYAEEFELIRSKWMDTLNTK